MKKKILILGGDVRNEKLFYELKRRGYETEYFSDAYRENEQAIKQQMQNTRFIVLPMVLKEQRICGMDREQIVSCCEKGTRLFCGMADKPWQTETEKRGIELISLLTRETYARENAYYTAEGALCLIQQKTQASLWQKRCVIVGSGRIAQNLFPMLKLHTPYLSVVARNRAMLAQFACWQAKTFAFDKQTEAFDGAEIVFNTVPESIISPKALNNMAEGGCYMELASAPYGCVWEEIPLGINKLMGSGIPGKMFAVSAAKSMATAMLPYLK